MVVEQVTAATRARAVIKQSIKDNDLPIDNIYCFNWPNDANLDDTDKTDILITEVNDMPTTYGSNRSNEMAERVAINIFYASDSTIDFDKLEQPLLGSFEQQGWFCVYSPGHSIDPDTKQVTKVFQFEHLQRKGEI